MITDRNLLRTTVVATVFLLTLGGAATHASAQLTEAQFSDLKVAAYECGRASNWCCNSPYEFPDWVKDRFFDHARRVGANAEQIGQLDRSWRNGAKQMREGCAAATCNVGQHQAPNQQALNCAKGRRPGPRSLN